MFQAIQHTKTSTWKFDSLHRRSLWCVYLMLPRQLMAHIWRCKGVANALTSYMESGQPAGNLKIRVQTLMTWPQRGTSYFLAQYPPRHFSDRCLPRNASGAGGVYCRGSLPLLLEPPTRPRRRRSSSPASPIYPATAQYPRYSGQRDPYNSLVLIWSMVYACVNIGVAVNDA